MATNFRRYFGVAITFQQVMDLFDKAYQRDPSPVGGAYQRDPSPVGGLSKRSITCWKVMATPKYIDTSSALFRSVLARPKKNVLMLLVVVADVIVRGVRGITTLS